MSRSRKESPKAFMPYEVTGPKDKPVIVLLPGGLSGWVGWKPHADVLSRDYMVIRVQLLNMAAAEKNQTPDEGYSLKSESEALKNTLDKIGVKRVNLVGWSHGGAVSLDCAMDHPESTKTLTLIEPAVYWVARAYDKFGLEMQEFIQMINRFKPPIKEDDLIKFLKMNGLVPPGEDVRNLPQWPTWNLLKTALLSLHTVPEHNDSLDRMRVLRNIPVLLVRGKESKGFNFGVEDLIAKTLGSNTKVVDLPDAHASHIVAKDQFISLLHKFLSSAK